MANPLNFSYKCKCEQPINWRAKKTVETLRMKGTETMCAKWSLIAAWVDTKGNINEHDV